MCLILVSGGCSASVWGHKEQKNGLPTIDIAQMGKKVLVIAPHPDDEGLAAAGLIHQALRQKVDVKVVIITTGDAAIDAVRLFSKNAKPSEEDFRLLGNARCQETRDAMSVLGLPRRKLTFLAYGDGSLNSLWNVAWDYSQLHTGRNGTDHSPYPFAYEKGAPCCGSNLEKNLSSILKDFKPTSIIYPAAEDDHHDHWAANAFVQYTILCSDYRGKEYTYMVHRYDFPEPAAFEPLEYLELPSGFASTNTRWQRLPLSRREENKKAKVLEAYAIPRKVKETFVDAFIRRNELFGITQEIKPKRIGSEKPDFTSKQMPYVVDEDPSYDSLAPGLGGSELTKVSFCIGDSRAYLAVETKGYAVDSIVYAFRLRLFKGNKVGRLDINVFRKKALCQPLASNSIRLNGPIPVHMRENRLWIDLPAYLFSGKNACMLSVDSTVRTRHADRTAWRRLLL